MARKLLLLFIRDILFVNWQIRFDDVQFRHLKFIFKNVKDLGPFELSILRQNYIIHILVMGCK